ncbi:unnamed protein product [Rhizophagus irregularis]|nr:unnamed protein product [Rhizophagus irregularis]
MNSKNAKVIKCRKTTNSITTAASPIVLKEPVTLEKKDNSIECDDPSSNMDNLFAANGSMKEPTSRSHSASALKNTVNNNNTNRNINKLKYTGRNNSKIAKNLKNQGSVSEIISLDSSNDISNDDISNDDIPDNSHIETSDDSHLNSLTYKPKFATPEILAILVNEAKIMFLRARNLPPAAYNNTLVKLVAQGFTETSKTASFLRSKLNAYYADHQSCLNTEARAYGQNYIINNENPIAQVIDSWWKDDKDAVDAFRMLIASAIKIHIINILKCKEEPHISNAPALNEVKTLDYITHDLHLLHNNATNYANNIDQLESSISNRSHRRERERRRERDRGSYGHSGGFGRK